VCEVKTPVSGVIGSSKQNHRYMHIFNRAIVVASSKSRLNGNYKKLLLILVSWEGKQLFVQGIAKPPRKGDVKISVIEGQLLRF
jgi:hypothetical protein